MKLIKYIYIYSVLAIFCCLYSCSEDLTVYEQGKNNNPQDGFNIEFVIPDVEHILTRADEVIKDITNERKVNNLAILIFNDQEELIKISELTSEELTWFNEGIVGLERNYTYQLIVSESEKQQIHEIYAVANYIVKVSDTQTKDLLEHFKDGSSILLGDLLEISNTLNYDYKNGFLMSGKLNETNVISLTRTAAKVTLKDESKNKKFNLLGFGVYYPALQCYLAGNLRTNPFYTTKGNNPVIANQIPSENGTVYRYDCYVNPTKTHDGSDVSTYIVIEGEYDGTKGYYAIPLYNKTKKINYDIEPNHWYELIINEVNLVGKNRPEDALNAPEAEYLSYTIHDHTPEVLSMITDGIRELGVKRQVDLSTSNNTAILRIKCLSFSSSSSSEENTKPTISIINGKDWIIIPEENNPVKVVIDKSNDKVASEDNEGTQWDFTIKAGDNLNADKIGEVEVTWQNLTRRIKVYYEALFNPTEFCKSSLQIKVSGDNWSTDPDIKDYWTFVAGNGTTSKEKTEDEKEPKLFGIKRSELKGEAVRTEGLHFPMPYGEDDNNLYEYRYEIDFSQLENHNQGKTINYITFETEGDEFFKKENFKWFAQYPKFILELENGKNSYEYAQGSITFKVEFQNDYEPVYFTADLYHTGFFYFAGDEKYYDQNSLGYYYYEVVPMGEDSNKQPLYWLDRNIGAKSNRMYVDNESEKIGTSDAGGLYYSVAFHESFQDPTFDKNICPPGYHIPVTSEWNAIRLSSHFTSKNLTDEDGNTYMSTYYDTRNKEIGYVYFPKGRFLNSANTGTHTQKYELLPNSGDASAGYYWTATTAPAMEKEEMGNWLRALYINGTSTSYVNASMADHKMYVRAIKGSEIPKQQDKYISFNVHNVTHVFLFDLKSKTSLYSFPGKAVGSAESSSKWQNFYCTTTADLNNLYMLFTKIDANGTVTVYTRNGSSFIAERRFDSNIEEILKAEYAWKVDECQSAYLDFCDKAKDQSKNVYGEQPKQNECSAEKTELYNGPTKIIAGDKLKFKWRNYYEGKNHNFIYLVSGGSPLTTDDYVDWKGWRGKEVWADDSGFCNFEYNVEKNISDLYLVIWAPEDHWSKIRFEMALISSGFVFINNQIPDRIYGDGSQNLNSIPEGGSVTPRARENSDNYDWEIVLYTNSGN